MGRLSGNATQMTSAGNRFCDICRMYRNFTGWQYLYDVADAFELQRRARSQHAGLRASTATLIYFLPDYAAAYPAATAAERRIIGIIVAACMNHQGAIFDIGC